MNKYHIHPRNNFTKHQRYAAADLFEHPEYEGRCKGVLMHCKSGIVKVPEGCPVLPEDIIIHKTQDTYDKSMKILANYND